MSLKHLHYLRTHSTLSYSGYLSHQAAKLADIYDRLQANYGIRLEQFADEFDGLTVLDVHTFLCLGARDGAEVDALRRKGKLAVGIDIAYPLESPFVHFGDFQNIPYPDHSFDSIYTNVLDHVFDFQDVMKECRRVLKLNGWLLARIQLGTEEGYKPGRYETLVWPTRESCIEAIEECGFRRKRVHWFGSRTERELLCYLQVTR